jgi:hypothetical protein
MKYIKKTLLLLGFLVVLFFIIFGDSYLRLACACILVIYFCIKAVILKRKYNREKDNGVVGSSARAYIFSKHNIVNALLIFAIAGLATQAHFLFPPQILSILPFDGSDNVPLDQEIKLIFKCKMNRASVERSFSISPQVAGHFVWNSGNTQVTYVHDRPLERQTTYELEVKNSARSALLVPQIGNFTSKFSTERYPSISLAKPTKEADINTNITVMFDHPVAALGDFSEEKQIPFVLSPITSGKGRWLGTSTYQFVPDQPLAPATTYNYKISAGLKFADGEILREEKNYSFSTTRPKLVSSDPSDVNLYANNNGAFQLYFNLPISLESAKQKVTLSDANFKIIPIKVDINKLNIVRITPLAPLEKNESYQIVVASGLLSYLGPNGVENDSTINFRTAPEPRIIGITNDSFSEVDVEFASPMQESSFAGRVHITPKLEQKQTIYFSSYNNENKLNIGANFFPETEYTIKIDGSVTDVLGNVLGREYVGAFKTKAREPGVSIFPSGTYFATFNQQITPRVVSTVTNSSVVNYKLFKLEQKDFLDLYNLKYLAEERDDWQKYDPSNLKLVRQWTESINLNKNVPTNIVTKVTGADGADLPAGMYFIDVIIENGRHDNMVMIVSKGTITMKSSPNQILVWAVDQNNAKALPDYEIQLVDSDGKLLGSGKTNKDGVYLGNTDNTELHKTDVTKALFAFAKKGDDFAVVADSWDKGIEKYNYNLSYYYSTTVNKNKIFLFTDRPIYRPGQTINFKGVVRQDNDGKYSVLTGNQEVVVTVKDHDEKEIFNQKYKLNSYGTLAGSFNISEAGAVGEYSIEGKIGENVGQASIQVEEYKKPDFFVETSTDKEIYVDGDAAKMTVEAKYFFGAPIVGKKVKWRLTTSDQPFSWWKDKGFEFGDSDSYWYRPWWSFNSDAYYGEDVTNGNGVTDAQGKYEVNIPLNIRKKTAGQAMFFEATIEEDTSNQVIASSKQFTVEQGKLQVGLKPKDYVYESGKKAQVSVATVDINGQEQINTPVNISIYKRTWNSVRTKDVESGELYWESKPFDKLVTTTKTITGTGGLGEIGFIPAVAGNYRVVASVTDKNSKTLKSSTSLWVYGPEETGYMRESSDRIALIPNKQEYQIGEEASIYPVLPFKKGIGLLTIERSNVLDYKIISENELGKASKIVVDEKYSPNAFISGVYIKPAGSLSEPAEIKMGIAEIRVNNPKNKVNVTITPTKSDYKPGDQLTFSVETKNDLGQPVQAEVALGVTDEAIWTLSSKSVYGIYADFYQPKNLLVSTAAQLAMSLDRINATLDLGRKGGSGGGKGGGDDQDSLRENLLDTAYWKTNIETGRDGKASVTVKLPDNTTTWRIHGVALDKETAVGEGVAKIVVGKDMVIQPLLPRFLVVGDRIVLGANFHNQTNTTKDIMASIQIEGADIKQELNRPLSIKPNSLSNLQWEIIPRRTGEIKIIFSAKDNNQILDSTAISLNSVNYFVEKNVVASGEAKDFAQEKIKLPKDAAPNYGGVTFSLSSMLGADVMDAANYFLNYPYWCTEQSTSKLLFALSALSYQKEISGNNNNSDAKNFQAVVDDALQRIINAQAEDGGWGWWSGAKQSDVFLTSMALDGLLDAKEQGQTVSEDTIKKAKNYLSEYISQNDPQDFSYIFDPYAVSVLARDYPVDDAILSNLMDNRGSLSMTAQAYLLKALHLRNKTSDYDLLSNEIFSQIKQSGNLAHWEEKKEKDDWFFMSDDVTLTSIMLENIIAKDSKNPIIPNLVRWLVQNREDQHWSTTRNSAVATRAIVATLLAQKKNGLAKDWEINIGNIKSLKGVFGKGFNATADVTNKDLFGLGEVPVKIGKSGSGSLFYNIGLKYFLPFAPTKEVDNGLTVIRDFMDKDGKEVKEPKLSVGNDYFVRLTLAVPDNQKYLIVEDKLPAGVEAVNESLATTPAINTESLLVKDDKETDTQQMYFDHKEIRDDRVVLFASEVPAGVYEFRYRVRPTLIGSYKYPSARFYNMYSPDVFGASSARWLEIVPKQ